MREAVFGRVTTTISLSSESSRTDDEADGDDIVKSITSRPSSSRITLYFLILALPRERFGGETDAPASRPTLLLPSDSESEISIVLRAAISFLTCISMADLSLGEAVRSIWRVGVMEHWREGLRRGVRDSDLTKASGILTEYRASFSSSSSAGVSNLGDLRGAVEVEGAASEVPDEEASEADTALAAREGPATGPSSFCVPFSMLLSDCVPLSGALPLPSPFPPDPEDPASPPPTARAGSCSMPVRIGEDVAGVPSSDLTAGDDEK